MAEMRGQGQPGVHKPPSKASPRPNWTPLLKEIPSLLDSDFGGVIVGSRTPDDRMPCNYLVTDQNFLAVMVDMINKISTARGQEDLSSSRVRELPGVSLALIVGLPSY